MNTWRITTNFTDNTARASESNPIVGATVIDSPKGVNKFFKFYKGDTQGIIDLFIYQCNTGSDYIYGACFHLWNGYAACGAGAFLLAGSNLYDCQVRIRIFHLR